MTKTSDEVTGANPQATDSVAETRQDEESAVAALELSTGASSGFPIVGIGASAGGLAAFEAFFSGMPKSGGLGIAFVLVQHLAPDHESILSTLIQRYTQLDVLEITDGMEVRPDCVYVIPPARNLEIFAGSFQLLEPSSPHGHRMPIDIFFRSLALEQRERAICIVLSGTGSDGTLGIRSIKGEGGMTMVQVPDSAEFDGMPMSALATGLVDYEMPPAEMLGQIVTYVSHALARSTATETTPRRDEKTIKKILMLLRSHSLHDFSQYKPNTVYRRIERRMAVHQMPTIRDYATYLQATPAEVDSLFNDLLIGVTNFFRDPDAFEALETSVIPALFKGRAANVRIRIWVPGCSTGEEAYSLAILLYEYQTAMKVHFPIQVFATDIDCRSIATARAGIYSASIAADISPERLQRFFILEPDGCTYRVQKYIRDLLIFSEQNLIRDPPFSKLDMISCRNLLIYMNSDLQKKIIPLFHYALSPHGHLFLGTSETIGDFSELFDAVDRKSKIYQAKASYRHTGLVNFLPSLSAVSVHHPRKRDDTVTDSKRSWRELAEQTLLQQLSSAAVLVTANGDILFIHGRTGSYMEPAAGESGVNNILKMARDGLQRDLTTALHRASTSTAPIHHRGLRVKTNGDYSLVDLTVARADGGSVNSDSDDLFLVIMEPSRGPELDTLSPSHASGMPLAPNADTLDVDQRIAVLEQELLAKDEYLQATNEELETSIEELKSSNEEMQSMNEELQSTNEELETSKEELQSLNEELATVNTELQAKVSDLTQANNDMNNLLAGTGIATLFVDLSLRIVRYTPATTRIINLIQGDLGRPVGHIVSNLPGYDRLVPDIQEVLDTLVPIERQVLSDSGTGYVLRIRPYRTLENVIEGAVITFVDITSTKSVHNEQ